MSPGRGNPHGAGVRVEEYRRVAHAILSGRQTAIFAKRERQTHGFPTLTAIGAATQPHVDVLLQVDTTVIAHVIHPQQRTPVGRHQPGNAESRHPVVAGMAHPDSHAVLDTLGRYPPTGSYRPVERDRLYPGPQFRGERGARLHLHTHPKEVDTRIELVISPQLNPLARIVHTGAFNRIGRVGRQRLTGMLARYISDRGKTILPLVLPGLHTPVIEFHGSDIAPGIAVRQIEGHPVEHPALTGGNTQIEQHIVLPLEQHRHPGLLDKNRIGGHRYRGQSHQGEKKEKSSHDTFH